MLHVPLRIRRPLSGRESLGRRDSGRSKDDPHDRVVEAFASPVRYRHARAHHSRQSVRSSSSEVVREGLEQIPFVSRQMNVYNSDATVLRKAENPALLTLGNMSAIRTLGFVDRPGLVQGATCKCQAHRDHTREVRQYLAVQRLTALRPPPGTHPVQQARDLSRLQSPRPTGTLESKCERHLPRTTCVVVSSRGVVD